MNDSVLLPVPSCITSKDTNCPAIAPLPAPNVLCAPHVTFATGEVNTFHDIVEASGSVASGFTAAAANEA